MKNLIKTYFRTTSTLAPTFAGNQAFELFQRPLNKKIRSKELPFYDRANKFTVKHYLEDIHCYEVGPKTGHLIVMVHGWESNAGSLSAIADELAKDGNRVILFNLPAHGYSTLKKANIKISKEVFLAVINHIQPQKPFSIVSHSFGSAVSAYALSKTTYEVDQLIFLTSPNKITKIFQDYSDFIGLGKRAHGHMCKKAENLLLEPLHKISVEDLSQKINYKNLLLIQDSNDKILPKSNAIEIYNQWRNSELYLIENSGHYKMLWDKNVIDKVRETIFNRKSNSKDLSGLHAMAF